MLAAQGAGAHTVGVGDPGGHGPVGGRGPGRPRDERADAAIMTATLDLLAEVGPTGLSVDEVAARAGVSKTTIYRRFATKDDLWWLRSPRSNSRCRAARRGRARARRPA